MFNIFNKKQSLKIENSSRNLGYLSVYNLESIYSFIGEERIQMKIMEFENIPTMGIRLEDYVYGKKTIGFYNKGPIECLTYLLNFFYEPDIVEHLFFKTLSFSSNTYMEKNSIWSKGREERIKNIINTIKRKADESDKEFNIERMKKMKIHLNYNYYYIDYHFFLTHLYSINLSSKNDVLKFKLNSFILPHYLPKLSQIKKSLIDMDIWTDQYLGNGILRPLMKYCKETDQSEKYEKYFKEAINNNWRF